MLKRNNIIIFARNPRSTLIDETYIKSCESFVQLKHEIRDQLYLLPLKSLKPIYKSIKVDIISLWNLY